MIPLLSPASARSVRRVFFLIALLTPAVLFSIWDHQSGSRVVAKSARTTSAHWYRGNTHTHSNNSFDGESSPVAVATTYKSLGYNFLFFTDHNKLTNIDNVNSEVGVPGQFLAIKGEEVTDYTNGSPVHIIGLNNNFLVTPQHGSSVLTTINNDINAVNQAGGVAILAHPNYLFAVNDSDFKNFNGTTFFEIFNAHPVVNNYGDATHSSVEAKWDQALSSGKLLYGFGVDDMHTLTNPEGPFPGRAWVMVRAANLDADSLIQAMANGDFYASTGVTLSDYQVSANGISIAVADNPGALATIDFIGRNGQLLQRSNANSASYAFTGHEQYVRAKITNDQGAAWTQPTFTERLNPTDAIMNAAAVGTEPASLRTIAPDSIGLASGVGLATSAVQAKREEDFTFPSMLAGTTITVNGRPADIYYASSTQMTFHVPAETEPGLANVVVTNADGLQMRAQVAVENSAPGIFTSNGEGQGQAVVFDLDKLLGSTFLSDPTWRRFYVYATGVRNANEVQVLLNGQPIVVEAIRSCKGLPGLDQITIVVPRSSTGSGDATLVIQADGVASNTTQLRL